MDKARNRIELTLFNSDQQLIGKWRWVDDPSFEGYSCYVKPYPRTTWSRRLEHDVLSMNELLQTIETLERLFGDNKELTP